MQDVVLMVLLGLGLFLLALGVALGGADPVNTMLGELLAAGAGVFAIGLWVRGLLRTWSRSARIQRSEQSELAEQLTPQLFGNHPPYVIEAAEKLGDARDTTAVPHLIYALEQCVETQPPCWCEMGEALVTALARIGDRTALPVLFRLENVRGIGFISAIRSAIASIEPSTSLLRPGNGDALHIDLLLHPAHAVPDENPQALLRSVDVRE